MIIKQAKEVLKTEADGILNLIDKVNDSFIQMVELIYQSKGRLIISGIGKSGLICQKIVATLNSTGTKSLFLHPVEAMHGDLGMVCHEDIFLAVSNSGETDELNMLIPSIKKIGCRIISFTGNINSSLARQSDIIIDVGVKKEACPLGLAPTASTTATLAMGDALSVVLINKKHFDSKDFKSFHPGGALGQRLSLAVSSIMISGDNTPFVVENTNMLDAVIKMDEYNLGFVLVVKQGLNTLSGIITDGDLRRLILNKKSFTKATVNQIMTKNPQTIYKHTPAYDALNKMEIFQITVLPVVDESGISIGAVHMHDIFGKGSLKF